MRHAILLPIAAVLVLSACGQGHHATSASVKAGANASSASAGDTGYAKPFRVVHHRYTAPGVLKFGKQETYESKQAHQGTIMALYPVSLESGESGHLIIIKLTRGRLFSVVQPDVDAFSLHKGDSVILTGRSDGTQRILPFNPPSPATGS